MTTVSSPSGDLEKRETDQVAPATRAKTAGLVIEDDDNASADTLIYREKIAVLNDAIQEVGMGRYQW